MYAPSESISNVVDADGFVGADATVPVAEGVTVADLIGR